MDLTDLINIELSLVLTADNFDTLDFLEYQGR